MKNSATIPLVVCACAVFSISAAVAQETRPTIAAEITGIDKRLDAMPPEFLRKMLRGGRLVGSPGLTWEDKSVLTVAFRGGSDELYQLIEQTANEWTALGRTAVLLVQGRRRPLSALDYGRHRARGGHPDQL